MIAAEAHDDTYVEIPTIVSEAISSWRRILERTTQDPLPNFERAAIELSRLARQSSSPHLRQAIFDSIYNLGVTAGIDDDQTQEILSRAEHAPADGETRTNGHAADLSPVPLTATVFACRPAIEIAPRPRLFGPHYIRGFCSATFGRPGLGKTALLHAEALSMATATNLVGSAPEQPLRPWYIGEDPQDEIERRLVAACQRYRISPADLEDRLFADSTLELPPLKLAEMKGKGLVVNREAIDGLAAEIERRKIDVLILDPLIKFHGVPESDNTSMEVVMRALAELARRTYIAIELSHHIRKQAPGTTGPATVDDGRGASAIVGAIRSARVLNAMQPAEAAKAGVIEGDRWRYLRIDHAKGNMAPPEAARWLMHASEILPCNESVGVIAPWKFPDAFAGVTGADLSAVRELARTGAYRSDERAADWFGFAVGEHLGLDIDDKTHRAKVKVLIKTWFKNKALDVESRYDQKQRKDHDYVVPGPWSDLENAVAQDAQVQ
jgi:hypothetical protein